ncbi:hypothetical protein [uncultured Mediterranean phage uvMED]|nr:hypothetical protein [uncultured Mediterranean phage uvMED]
MEEYRLIKMVVNDKENRKTLYKVIAYGFISFVSFFSFLYGTMYFIGWMVRMKL